MSERLQNSACSMDQRVRSVVLWEILAVKNVCHKIYYEYFFVPSRQSLPKQLSNYSPNYNGPIMNKASGLSKVNNH